MFGVYNLMKDRIMATFDASSEPSLHACDSKRMIYLIGHWSRR
jgi:hypothetical protein